MSLIDLFKPMPPGAKVAGRQRSLVDRLRDAARTPPHPNRYVAPRLRTLDALAFALRGYRVFWTTPHLAPELDVPHTATINPSVLVYQSDRWRSGHFRHPVEPVFVEVPMTIPGEVHRLASWAKGARVVGWRFALWQARREIVWVVQARAARGRR